MKKILIILLFVFSFSYLFSQESSIKYYIGWLRYPMIDGDTNVHVIFSWEKNDKVNYRLTRTAFILSNGNLVDIKPIVKLSGDRLSYKENFVDATGTFREVQGVFNFNYEITSIRNNLFLFKDKYVFAVNSKFFSIPVNLQERIEKLYYSFPYTNSYYEVSYTNAKYSELTYERSIVYLKDYFVSEKYEPQIFTDDEKGIYAIKKIKPNAAAYFEDSSLEKLIKNLKSDNIIVIGNSRINRVKFDNREPIKSYDLEKGDEVYVDILEYIGLSNYVKLMNVEDLDKFSFDSLKIEK